MNALISEARPDLTENTRCAVRATLLIHFLLDGLAIPRPLRSGCLSSTVAIRPGRSLSPDVHVPFTQASATSVPAARW